MPAPRASVRNTLVVAPNFKRRLSGVTSTIVQLVPLQARTLAVAALGPGLPPHLPRLRLRDLPWLWRRPAERPFRIWHARRNNEMLAGVVLRDVLRMPIRLVFTSAAQRRHKAWTRFLIRRMDAVIATSGKSAAFLEVPATVILHGIDLRRFGPDGPVAHALPPDRLVVGCSGRIRPSKGTDLFVAAMVELLPRYPNWTAVVTGRATPEHASFLASLRRQVEEAGLAERILFVGESPDVAGWFRRFDLYLAPPNPSWPTGPCASARARPPSRTSGPTSRWNAKPARSRPSTNGFGRQARNPPPRCRSACSVGRTTASDARRRAGPASRCGAR